MTPTQITPKERADAIIKDILVNHLPRIIDGLRVGYVDENQILVMYDHAVRARILREGLPKCANCGNLATCFGQYENNPEGFACDACCGHGNEDGHCSEIHP